jgi:hypothetical protein
MNSIQKTGRPTSLAKIFVETSTGASSLATSSVQKIQI